MRLGFGFAGDSGAGNDGGIFVYYRYEVVDEA